METFLFGDYLYQKPVYNVVATNSEEIPEALQQLEKLRHSGYLAGYIRFDFACSKPGAYRRAGAKPAHLLHFTLYRRRIPANIAPKERLFCPTIQTGLNKERFFADVEGFFAGNPLADQVFSQETLLASNCSGEDIFASIGKDLPLRCYYKDTFEEILCLSQKKFLSIQRDSQTHREQINLDAWPNDSSLLQTRLQDLCEEVQEQQGKVQGTLKEQVTIASLLKQLFPLPSVLGATAIADFTATLEKRSRGMYGGIMGVFGAEESVLCLADCVLEKRPDDTFYRYAVGVRMQADSDKEAAFASLEQQLFSFCRPQSFQIETKLRLENGAVFLLKEHLQDLYEKAQSYGLDSTELASLLQSTVSAPGSSPNDTAELLPEAFLHCWAFLPGAWRDELLAQGHDPDKNQQLTLTLTPQGMRLSVQDLEPLTSRAIGYVRTALDERNDLLPLEQEGLPCEDNVRTRIQKGEWLDALVVNRFALVAGATKGDLIFALNGVLCTPPADTGMRNGIVRRLLLNKKIIQERALSLPQALAAQKIYYLDAVQGIVAVTLVDPQSLPE